MFIDKKQLARCFSRDSGGLDLKPVIDIGRHSPAGRANLRMKGFIMTGYIEEFSIPRYCNWKGPFQARLAVIRGVPFTVDVPARD